MERLQSLLDEMAATLRPEMAQHIALYGEPASIKEWEKNIASMRAEIAVRHRIVQEQICERFRLTKAQWDAIMAEAQRNAG